MLEFEVDFVDALIDIDRKLTLKGAPAQAELIIQTKTERGGEVWRSQITVQADEQGQVDLSQVQPLAGSYTETSAMGLWYSQRPEHAAATDVFPESVHHALHTEIEAQCGELTAQTVVTQRLTHANVQRVELNEPQLKGVLFVASAAGARPALLMLKPHSTGVLNEAQAALFAARGYTTLVLDYTQTPSLEATETELEPFRLALQWLRDQTSPKNNFVGVCGDGAGAELAVLLGVRLNSQVSAVIACEPTAPVQSDYPLAVEDSLGPILLASGKLHSSNDYQRAIGQRLQQHGFDYNFQWYNYEGVSAGLSFPHVPTLQHVDSASEALVLAQANRELWYAIIGFLHQAVIEAARPHELNS